MRQVLLNHLVAPLASAGHRRVAVISAACAALAAGNALAASGTWSSSPVDSDWSNSSNWSSGTIAGGTTGKDTVNSDTATFGSSSQLTVQPDANRIVKDITFSSTAGAYNISGSNLLSLAPGGTISGNNASTITFSAPLFFGGDYNLKPATGQTFNFTGVVQQHGGRSFQLGSGNTGTINFNGGLLSSGLEVNGIANGDPATGNALNVRWLGTGATTVNLNSDNSALNSRVTLSFDAGNTKGVANVNHAGVIYSNQPRGPAGIILNNGGTVNVNAANAVGGTNAYVSVGTHSSDLTTTLSLLTIKEAQGYEGLTTIGKTYTAGQARTASQALLLVNNSTGSGTGNSDITVHTGTLGGGGFIVNSGAKGVTVQSHGALSPGASTGAIGTLTMNLGSKGLNLTNGISDTNTQSLLFDLDTPGHSDQVKLLGSSVLTIGTGLLEFDDFVFTAGSNFAPGTYTLFSTAQPIVGSLGTNVSGAVGGISAMLALANSNQDIVLTVVPEPGTMGVLVIGAMGLLARRRRVG